MEILQDCWDNASMEDFLEEIQEHEDKDELVCGLDDELTDEMEM